MRLGVTSLVRLQSDDILTLTAPLTSLKVARVQPVKREQAAPLDEGLEMARLMVMETSDRTAAW